MSDCGLESWTSNLSELSRHSQEDSGFSDSECCTIVKGYKQGLGSIEDISHIPPPSHTSTPKTKNPESRNRVCPINLWLEEVRYWCDTECMSTLQNKPITTGASEEVTRTTSIAVSAIRSLHRQLLIICDRLNTLYRRLKAGKLNNSQRSFDKIIRRMEKALSEFNIKCSEEFQCSELQARFDELCNNENEITLLVSFLKNVAQTFGKNVEQILLKYIKMLVKLLNEETTPSSLSVVLSGIMSLEIRVPHLAELLALCSGISSLLRVTVDSSSSAVRTTSLSILASTCCTTRSIEQFEMSGGLDVICDVLSCNERNSAEKCAAVSVFAQVTGPWLDITVQGIQKFVEILVPSITNLINNNSSVEMLMMCASALANISSIEVKSVKHLVSQNSVGILLKAIGAEGPKASVFVKEQVATLLANISATNGALTHLRTNRSVPALLCFLQASISPLHSPREKAATFRLQHKAVIALSRLCNDPNAAKQVVELQGVSELVRLCKHENERNFNDSVLVACLVALRKIVTHCGSDAMKSLNASDLVEKHLLESFLLYSSNKTKYN